MNLSSRLSRSVSSSFEIQHYVYIQFSSCCHLVVVVVDVNI